jgi:hypothetical protein
VHTASLLPDGRVLVAGGMSEPGKWPALTETWDPVTETFSAGPPLDVPRSAHAATILADGRVVVIGGDDGVHEGLASVEYVIPEP